MIRRADGWSVVLAGFWNRSIFLPEWTLPRLFVGHEEEVQTEVDLLPALPLIYRDTQVQLEVSGGRLAFRPQALDDECLLRCERMARQMLESLPETPVHAVGINFGFREAVPPGRMVEMFRSVDDGELAGWGWAIGERKLVRRLVYGEDAVVLTMAFGGEAVDFDFNFHDDTLGSCANALRAMGDRRTIRLRDAAVGLLRDTYHLKIEENDGDGGG